MTSFCGGRRKALRNFFVEVLFEIKFDVVSSFDHEFGKCACTCSGDLWHSVMSCSFSSCCTAFENNRAAISNFLRHQDREVCFYLLNTYELLGIGLFHYCSS